MTSENDEAHLAVRKAREALRNGKRGDARRWAERAAQLAPQLEDPWLILAAIASPQASLDYLHKAQQINPTSPRARRGMEWALERVRAEQPASAPPVEPVAALAAAPSRPIVRRVAPRLLLPVLLAGLGLLVCVAAAVSARRSPVLAAIVQEAEPTRPASWAEVEIPKPTYTPAPAIAFESLPTSELLPAPFTELPTQPPAAASEPPTTPPTLQPTVEARVEPQQPTPEATFELPTAEPTWSGSLSLSYVQDTPTPEGAVSPAQPSYSAGSGVRWIDVNLSQQAVYAYEGDTLMNSFIVSTGTWLHPTVTGKYHVYVKLRYTDMSGPDYYLPNVPYTMYFFKGYALHGTYWHHNFGTPMSHGCVNLSIPDAQWLYNFASVGTLVSVHY